MTKRKTGQDYKISVEFWNKIKPLLPLLKSKKKLGRPREDDFKILSGIFYVLRTGCQWKALPRCYGAPSTVHDRFYYGVSHTQDYIYNMMGPYDSDGGVWPDNAVHYYTSSNGLK